ncbi:uncharacterized protein [Pyxicephalus adspersus]|uniref:uncharacterized protein n=1 Tax=Pyxicephalus adspersus TaxID=30357 RepID=UPI003B5CB3CB
MPGCFVKGCQSGRCRASEDLKLHCFPRRTETVRRWLLQLGHQPETVDILAGVIYSNQTRAYRICSKHFTPDAYEKRGSLFFLKTDALPTLYLEEVTAPDHSYYKKRKVDNEPKEIPGSSERNPNCPFEENTTVLGTPMEAQRGSVDSATQGTQSQFTDGTCLDPLDVQFFEAVETTEILADEICLDFQSAGYGVCRKMSDRVFTSNDGSAGRIQKPSPFYQKYGSKNKAVQVKTRQAYRSIAVQCNLAKLPSLSKFNKFQSHSEDVSTTKEYQLDDSYTMKVEEDFDQEMAANEELYFDPSDMDSSFLLLSEEEPKHSFVDEKKYLVFDSCLHKLLMSCKCQSSPSCNGNIIRVKKFRIGSAISVIGYCSENHKFNLWRSQPMIGRKPVGNLLISAAIVCSGTNFLKIENFFNMLNMFGIKKSTHYTNQHNVIFPTIDHFWQLNRWESFDLLQNDPVALVGEGHFHPSGHSANYCIYNFLDFKSKRIIDFQVEVQTGTSATALRRKSVEIGLDRLIEDGLNIYVLCTDRHQSIRKLLKGKYNSIVHKFDVRYIAKSVGNKILAASRRANCDKLAKWVSPTKNHLCWSASSCLHNPTLLVELWSSIVYHVSNHHHWESGHHYKKCHHGPIREDEHRTHCWLEDGSPAHWAFKDIVLNKKLLKDLKQQTFLCHTKDLESFHGTTLKYCSKQNHYCIDEMVAGTQLAALDYNYSLSRAQEGVKKTNGRTPAKKTWVDSMLYQATSQDFVKNIMFEMLELAAGHRNFTWQSRRKGVPTNIARLPRPDKAEFMSKYLFRC